MGKESFKCEFPGCGKVFTLKRNMLRHFKMHTEEKKHVCDYPGCKRRFHRASDLRSHLLTHDPSRKFPCTQPGCNASYTRRADLQTHIRKMHRQLSCVVEDCTATFKSKSRLQSHLRRDHDEDPTDPPFQMEETDHPRATRRRAKRRRAQVTGHGIRFAKPKAVVAKAEAPDHPRPLHQLLPSSLKEAIDPEPTLAPTMSDESISMLECMLDFETDWNLILGPPHAKRSKLQDSDFDDDGSWLTHSEAGCGSDMSDALSPNQSWLSPSFEEPAVTTLATTQSPPSTDITPLTSTTFTELTVPPTLTSTNEEAPHDFGRCSPLCDTHASKVLLSLHETPTPAGTHIHSTGHHQVHNHVHPHGWHAHHGIGCGHPIIKHHDHHDFLLPNGQVLCEEVGPVNIQDLLGEIELEEINGADFALPPLDEVKLPLPPRSTAFSSI